MKAQTLLLLLCLFPLLPAQETETLWDRARTAYDRGDFVTALDAYTRMRDTQGTSAALEYNLGNTHMRLGHYPEAIAHYRRAQWLDPRDPDLAANLDRARERTNAHHPPLPAPRKLSGFLAPQSWQTAFLALAWILAALLLLARYRTRTRRQLPWTAPPLALALLLAGAGVWASRPAPLAREAVLRGDTVTARFEPLDDATPHFTLPGGSIVRHTDRTRNWIRIAADGKQGWVPRDHLLLLENP